MGKCSTHLKAQASIIFWSIDQSNTDVGSAWNGQPHQINYVITCILTWIKKICCGRCNKRFTFQSNLNLHRNLHRRTKSYQCFAKDCSKRYKWPQDLIHHIKMHLKVKVKCSSCNYKTHENRLLLQHKNVHSRVTIFTCRRHCDKSFKHAMQCYCHELKCTEKDD